MRATDRTYLDLATGYPKDDALLKQEFDKLLRQPARRANIKKAVQFVSALMGRKRAPARKRAAAKLRKQPRSK